MALDWPSAPPNAAIARPKPSARPRLEEEPVLPTSDFSSTDAFSFTAASAANAGTPSIATMASTAKPFLSIRNPPFLSFRSMMMRVVRMFLVVMGVAVAVLLVVAALVDDLGGHVNGRE